MGPTYYDFVASKLEVSREFAVAFAVQAFEVSKRYGVQMYQSPSVIITVPVEYFGIFRENAAKRFGGLVTYVQSSSSLLPEKDEIVKRAGKALDKFQNLKYEELSQYALLKLRVKSGSAEGSEVEMKVSEFFSALGQVIYLEEIVAKGNALMKSATTA